MCFSASASFTAGALLSVIGVASIKKNSYPSRRLLASTPLLFATQQISEGVVWLALAHDPASILARAAPYAFLFFALLLWPVWIPMVLFIAEKNSFSARAWRRKILLVTLLIGIFVSLYLLVHVLRFGVTASISCSHIMYDLGLPEYKYFLGAALYLCATVLPWFITRIRWLWLLGVTFAIAYAITYIFYMNFMISTWCFFASILSMIILFLNAKPGTSSSDS